MGSGRMDPKDWDNYTAQRSYATKSTTDIFAAKADDPVSADLDPKKAKLRESRDSADNPESTAVILCLDVTGSMRGIVDQIVRGSLKTLIEQIYERKPVTDPHVMTQAVGDVRAHDPIPFQVSQFEADLRVLKQLELMNIHQGGGGNGSESYMLSWWFAAHRTSIDCFEKRQKKGYLFTLGDDGPTPDLTADELHRVFGGKEEAVNRDSLLTLVSRQWEIFHVTFSQGDTGDAHVQKQWRDLLGEHAIVLADHTKLAEVIVSIMQIREGTDRKKVIDSWDGSTSLVVSKATAGLRKRDTADATVTL